MASSTPDYSLFTSLRYDPELILTDWNERSPLMLEPLHVQRLQDASKKFGWEEAIKTMSSGDVRETFKRACKSAVQTYKGEDRAVMVRYLNEQHNEFL
jgi:hypothetical protein